MPLPETNVSKLSIYKTFYNDALEYVVCKTLAILVGNQCIDYSRDSCTAL